eukprot:CAMPEP_0183718092 /NCGR_PEP_ID=MMETSP0737-20130205/11443_1 /TAXON_ID=385413 /ORGANISM="Thalassiosira miniscula, Strain CCMP1093" /LENGTH=57 /DNA_ID=CAMNT_0025947581 /DNA_START=50 /DNA_END=220 /DNA_ORIENTATION=-
MHAQEEPPSSSSTASSFARKRPGGDSDFSAWRKQSDTRAKSRSHMDSALKNCMLPGW